VEEEAKRREVNRRIFWVGSEDGSAAKGQIVKTEWKGYEEGSREEEVPANLDMLYLKDPTGEAFGTKKEGKRETSGVLKRNEKNGIRGGLAS